MCGGSTCNDTTQRRRSGKLPGDGEAGLGLEECIPGRERREPGMHSCMESGRATESMGCQEAV